MKRKKHKSRYPLPENLVLAIEAIKDPTQRAIAACQAQLIGDTDRTRAILASCVAEADAFHAAAAGVLLAIRALPLGRPRAVVRPKPYVPPIRMPSLFEDAMPSAPTPELASCSTPIQVLSGADLVSELAAATLEATVEGDGIFADLVADPRFHELVERLRVEPAPRAAEIPTPNLFRDFEIEIEQARGPSEESGAPSMSMERRRRRRGPRPTGTNLIAMAAGHE